ncbi:MAG: DUF881 domain-containing protein [Chloroflexota bacterium]
MKKLSNAQLAVTVVCVILGIMLALQFRVQQNISKSLPLQRSEELVQMVKDLELERDKLRAEVTELRNSLANASTGGSRDELNRVRVQAGLTDMTGPGIVLTMDDSKKPGAPNQDPNLFLIHDDDVLKVINELKAAGAEAISINGQRLIGATEIRCAGPTISINHTLTAPPLEIRAIGDPVVLENSLRMRGGVIEDLSLWGIEISLRREQQVQVPAYTGSLQFNFARPVQGGR